MTLKPSSDWMTKKKKKIGKKKKKKKKKMKKKKKKNWKERKVGPVWLVFNTPFFYIFI